MARNRNQAQEANMSDNENQTEVTENTEATAAAVVEEPKADERYKLVTRPDTGAQVKRKDYILELWAAGKSRGEIAKHLTEITGKKVPYQIVFAATKDVKGGPAKPAEGASTDADAAATA